VWLVVFSVAGVVEGLVFSVAGVADGLVFSVAGVRTKVLLCIDMVFAIVQ
jgi:hypothetical protein